MNNKQQNPVKKLLAIRGMGAALTAFVGLVIIYIAFGLINSAVFSGQNILSGAPVGDAVQTVPRRGQHRVPHPELEGLIRVAVRVGDDVEPHHLICQCALAPGSPDAGDEGEGEGEEHGALPEPQPPGREFVHQKHRPM